MKNFPVAAFLLFTTVFGFSRAADAATATLDSNHGTTEFLAIGHPSALKVLGKGAGPTGALTMEAKVLSGTATFDMRTLDTGIDTRNEHMKKKYLEVERYPTATLKVSKFELPGIAANGDFALEHAAFQGMLTLHGVEKPVTGTADLTRKGAALDMVVHFSVKISDYNIATPGYAGITMADEVQVTVMDTASFSATAK